MFALSAGRSPRGRDLSPDRQATGTDDAARGREREPSVLSLYAAIGRAFDRPWTRHNKAFLRRKRLVAGRGRKTFRPRPGIRSRAERLDRGRLRRASGLSHRPLSRQGDGAEHYFLSLQQLDVRAG